MSATLSRFKSRESAPQRPPAPPASPEIREFLLFLACERGLAENTQLAYRRDLQDLSETFQRWGVTFATARAEHYRNYLQDQTRKKKATRTVARRLACVRVFLRFLASQ